MKRKEKKKGQLNLMLPIEGSSGSRMSLMRCGMFISLTADTALAGADDRPAYGGGSALEQSALQKVSIRLDHTRTLLKP